MSKHLGWIIAIVIVGLVAYEWYKKHTSAQAATMQQAAEAGVYDVNIPLA